jgi:tetratricopeptide (TPR) repeat protein
VLTAQPNEHEPALRKLKHISSVGLWRIPFEAVQYAYVLPQLAQEKPEIMQELNERTAIMTAEQMIYLGATQTVDRSLQAGQEQRQRTPRNVTLLQGRDYVLRGRFEDWDARPGARSVFLSFRPSEQEIDLYESSVKFINSRFADDPVMQKRWKDNDQQRAADMAHFGRTMRLSKSHATYWLGLTYFETEQYDNAIQWLEPLALGTADTGPWQAGARYLTARSYEALGKNDKAREFYFADDSPQAAGNKLRAVWLK